MALCICDMYLHTVCCFDLCHYCLSQELDVLHSEVSLKKDHLSQLKASALSCVGTWVLNLLYCGPQSNSFSLTLQPAPNQWQYIMTLWSIEYKWKLSLQFVYKYSPEKFLRLQQDSNPWPPRYQCYSMLYQLSYEALLEAGQDLVRVQFIAVIWREWSDVYMIKITTVHSYDLYHIRIRSIKS